MKTLSKGLNWEKKMGIRCLFVFGYLDLVINQVMNIYKINKFRIKAYSKKVWDLIDNFQEFNLTFIHKEKNHTTYSLELIASIFIIGDYEI